MMRGETHCQAGLPDVVEHPVQSVLRGPVGGARGFVQQQYPGLDNHGASHRGLLFLTVAEGTGVSIGELLDLDGLEGLSDACDGLVSATTAGPQAEHEIGFDRAAEQERLLLDQSHRPACGQAIGPGSHLFAVERQRSACRGLQESQNPQ